MHEDDISADDVTQEELSLVHEEGEASGHILDHVASLAKRFRHDRSLGSAGLEHVKSLGSDLRHTDAVRSDDVELDVEMSDSVDFGDEESEDG